ncbi:hypothetical protein Dsin_023225 [Dipteronia sinensis]|uniref:peptidylprolyl isomerase n=1 Tax=Dipteronia sinensis TaxID=43782 RepID=A0AAE0E0H2_9ROSI|nr:hypothetical protein Dsin_023225 [Dipteronia sinensis]
MEESDDHAATTRMEHEDAGQQYEEEKEDAIEPAAEMANGGIVENENLQEEDDDLEEAWSNVNFDILVKILQTLIDYNSKLDSLPKIDNQGEMDEFGNNQVSTSRGQASSSTSTEADQEIPFLEFTAQMTAVAASQTLVKMYADFQSVIEESDDHAATARMEHEDAGQRHEEEKEDVIEPAAEMANGGIVENQNLQEEDDDLEEAWSNVNFDILVKILQTLIDYNSKSDSLPKIDNQDEMDEFGNNQASTSRGQASSLTSAEADQEIPFLELTAQMTAVTVSQTLVKMYADFQRLLLDYRPFGRGQMQKPFEEATYALKIGEISDIVDANSGDHIIMRTG